MEYEIKVRVGKNKRHRYEIYRDGIILILSPYEHHTEKRARELGHNRLENFKIYGA